MTLPEGRFVDPAFNGGARSNHPNPPRACFSDGFFGRRLNDTHEGDPTTALQHLKRRTGRGVAGNHEGLDPFPKKKLRVLEREPLDLNGGLRSIGKAGQVAKIDNRLPRKLAADFTDHREAAQTRIKDTNRFRVHKSSR